jgi:hypothetical protein
MFQIVIHHPKSETVIHNIFPEELEFWKERLYGSVQGEIRIVEMTAKTPAP